MMNIFLTEDLWAIILSRLPLKTITASKLVCRQWKSVVESQFLRELFLSRHQNSHPSWSLLMFKNSLKEVKEVVAHYGCEIWGLQRSLGSYVSSFLTDKLREDDKHRPVWFDGNVSVVYSDVGLILISFRKPYGGWNRTYYVANPITRQCVELPPLPHLPLAKPCTYDGLATRIENGVVLSYKVVLIERWYSDTNNLCFLIYSSETGLWSSNTLRSPLTLRSALGFDPVSLNGKLYWLGHISGFEEVVFSYDFYATGTESSQCRIIPFPDLERQPEFRRSCTTSQGSLMYMNIFSEQNGDGSVEHKLSVWRLKSDDEWQLVSKISPACIKTRSDYSPLMINPFDADTMYLVSKMHKCLASTNVHKGKFGLHNNLERSSNGRTLSFSGGFSDLRRLSTFLSRFGYIGFLLHRH